MNVRMSKVSTFAERNKHLRTSIRQAVISTRNSADLLLKTSAAKLPIGSRSWHEARNLPLKVGQIPRVSKIAGKATLRSEQSIINEEIEMLNIMTSVMISPGSLEFVGKYWIPASSSDCFL